MTIEIDELLDEVNRHDTPLFKLGFSRDNNNYIAQSNPTEAIGDLFEHLTMNNDISPRRPQIR